MSSNKMSSVLLPDFDTFEMKVVPLFKIFFPSCPHNNINALLFTRIVFIVMERCSGNYPEPKYEVENCENPYNGSRWGYRHQQAIILFVYVVLAYSIRTCMAVILVAMIVKDANTTLIQTNMSRNTNGTMLHAFEETAVNKSKEDGVFQAMLLTPPYPKLMWSKQQQDFVLAAFFWGYCVMQIPGGRFSHRFGTRISLAVAMIINSVMFLFAPWMAYYGGWIAMAATRVIQGMAQSVMHSALHAFFGKWARLEERAQLTSYSYSGSTLGPLVGSLIGGLVAGSSLGWPGALRLFGVFAAIAAAAGWFWIADTPEQHPQISNAEKRFIYEGLGVPDGTRRRSIPWKHILSHPGMIAITATHITNAWTLNIIFIEMPRFMDNVLRINVKSIGLLMALILLIMFLANLAYGWISDVLIVRGWLTVGATRKLVNGFGMVFAAAGLIAMQFIPTDVVAVETIFILIASTKVASHSGFFVNHIDISPNYAGVMLSITSFLAYVVGAQSPLVTGAIVHEPSSVEQWRIVFHMTAGMLLVAAVLYQWLGTAERAAWDQPTCNQETIEEAKPMIAEDSLREFTHRS